jgi:hypothetical protein
VTRAFSRFIQTEHVNFGSVARPAKGVVRNPRDAFTPFLSSGRATRPDSATPTAPVADIVNVPAAAV